MKETNSNTGNHDPRLSPPFMWVGHTSRRLQLSASETKTLYFTAVLSCPGIYDLSNLRVFAQPSVLNSADGNWDFPSMVIQKLCPPSVIIIEDSSNSSFSNSCKDLINVDVT